MFVGVVVRKVAWGVSERFKTDIFDFARHEIENAFVLLREDKRLDDAALYPCMPSLAVFYC